MREPTRNGFSQIFLYSLESSGTPLTTDRYDSHSASWSSDGKWVPRGTVIRGTVDKNFVAPRIIKVLAPENLAIGRCRDM